jgi:hypothetical protein
MRLQTPPASTGLRRPDLFAPVTKLDKPHAFLYSGAADIRYRRATRETTGAYVAAGRFTGEWVSANRATQEEERGVRVQLLVEPDSLQRTAVRRLRFSELYAFQRLSTNIPGLTATVRGGQFVVPFGLLAVYDTPLQPIQPLYEKSLGLRVDTGVMVEGDFGSDLGKYHYAASITNGTGPNRADEDNNKVFCFRVERNFIGNLRGKEARIQLGGSLLSGRLPKTQFDTVLPASGLVALGERVDKTRFGIDGQVVSGNTITRGEIVFGGDGQEPVWGYFLEDNYRLTPRFATVAEAKWWRLPVKPQGISVMGVGVNYDLGNGAILRALYEYQRDVPLPVGRPPIVTHRFVLQTRLSF